MSDDRLQAAKDEIQRLLNVEVIRDIKYIEWLANVVLVKIKNVKWRMSINFTNLNKCCPKDDFPLPQIDSSVDKAAACELFSLLDCFSGYHQIWMKPEDEEKNIIYHSNRIILFRQNTRGSEKLRAHIRKNDKANFRQSARKAYHSLC